MTANTCWLAILHKQNIYVNATLSIHLILPPSPAVSTSSFSISMSLFPPCSVKLPYDTGSPVQGSVTTQRGVKEVQEDGYTYAHTYTQTHTHKRLIHVVVWQKPTQDCKAIILQLLIKNKYCIFYVKNTSKLKNIKNMPNPRHSSQACSQVNWDF